MSTQIAILEIEKVRFSLINSINTKFDRLILNLQTWQATVSTQADEPYTALSKAVGKHTVPLTIHPKYFLGKKPIAVLFGDKQVCTPKWAKVYEEILRHCIQDPIYHDRIMELRDKTVGKMRVLLSSTADGMVKPGKIDEGLYAEKHFSAEGLMRMLVYKILTPIDYDYSNIKIIIKI